MAARLQSSTRTRRAWPRPRNCARKLDVRGSGARFDTTAQTAPERAAEIIHERVKAGKSRVLVGPDAYLFEALARLAPSRYFDLFALLAPVARRRR